MKEREEIILEWLLDKKPLLWEKVEVPVRYFGPPDNHQGANVIVYACCPHCNRIIATMKNGGWYPLILECVVCKKIYIRGFGLREGNRQFDVFHKDSLAVIVSGSIFVNYCDIDETKIEAGSEIAKLIKRF